MSLFKRILDFYLQCSLHVALSAYCLIRITENTLGLLPDTYLESFGFFGTIIGYNFVKYDAQAREGRRKLGLKMKALIGISMVAFVGALYCFFHIGLKTQIAAGICLLITALYTLPFFPNRRNARSWSGLKIYIVAVCWVVVTVIMPVIHSGMVWTTDVYVLGLKRLILIVVLMFVFEIIDLAWDDPHLKTVPQQIGVKSTKRLGIILLAVLLVLELFEVAENRTRFVISLSIMILTVIFLGYAHARRSRYYADLYTESIPIIWWILLYYLN